MHAIWQGQQQRSGLSSHHQVGFVRDRKEKRMTITIQNTTIIQPSRLTNLDLPGRCLEESVWQEWRQRCRICSKLPGRQDDEAGMPGHSSPSHIATPGSHISGRPGRRVKRATQSISPAPIYAFVDMHRGEEASRAFSPRDRAGRRRPD
jgi:hypothetical protein